MEPTDKIQIFVMLGENLALGLANCRENRGHDDSLPYQSDVYAIRLEKTPIKVKLGSVWNDGWGGDTNFERIPNLDEIYDKINELCGKHKMYYGGAPFASYNLIDTVDCMAEDFCTIMASPKAKKSVKAKNTSLMWKFDDSPDILARGGSGLPVFFSNVLL